MRSQIRSAEVTTEKGLTMPSKKPYIIRALYQWIMDSDCTPHLVINTKSEIVKVPREFVKDNKIVLNISPTSANKLEIDNEYILFYAKFNGIEQRIYAPITAVLAIYAAEDGEGFMFEEEPVSEKPKKENEGSGNKNKGYGGFKIVDKISD